jgi:hypothetical protein
MHGGDGYPVDFKIQTWDPSIGWIDRVNVTNAPKPSQPQHFSFGATTQYIRVYATNLRQVGEGGYQLQMAEIEVIY